MEEYNYGKTENKFKRKDERMCYRRKRNMNRRRTLRDERREKVKKTFGIDQ
jgi:hypothetical protein